MRSFGTEGRALPPGAAAIPGSSQVYDFIVFRGADIKDLSVEEHPAAAPVPPAVRACVGPCDVMCACVRAWGRVM